MRTTSARARVRRSVRSEEYHLADSALTRRRLTRGITLAMRKAILALLLVGAMVIPFVERTRGQPPVPVQPNATPPNTEPNLPQLMKGTLYPESNVVFAAQDVNPADVPHAKDPAMATDLLTSAYGKWEAVENSALAIAEDANLLILPGRKCSNGLDVPVKNPDWAKFVQELRDAGMTAYAAAQSKDQDRMIDDAGVMTTACAHSHNKYRENRNPADRCK